MNRQPFRVTPALPAGAMKTYRIARPKTADYWVPATCGEVDCDGYLNGWESFADETTALGQEVAHTIRRRSGRKFTEEREYRAVADLPAAIVPTLALLPGTTHVTLTVFTFAPGQMCFASANHSRPVEREPLYIVRGGDWRGNPRGTRQLTHADARDWVDDFGEHQQTLADRLAQG